MTTDTSTVSLPTSGPLAWGPPLRPQPPLPRSLWLVVGLVLVLFSAVVAACVPVPYYAIAPGSAREIDGLIRVDAPGQAYPPEGDILLTTVSLGPVDNVYEAFDGWLDRSVDVVHEREILGPSVDRDEYTRQNVQAMTDSKEVAEFVALQRLGHPVSTTGEGVLVMGVVPGTAAVSRLHPGDVIAGIDGQPIRVSGDLVAALRDRKPGDVVTVDVRPSADVDEPRQVQVPLSARRDGTALLGVSQQTWRQTFSFPFRVHIESGQIGGPSAGLAFTLAILDVLTPGELTGGVPIAATGTIDVDGRIGPVGGIAQKVVAVKRAGARLLIVPPEEYEVAVARAGKGLRVEKAATLDEALQVLATMKGSNALALGAPPAQ